MAFLVAENENRQLEDFPYADFGCLTETSFTVRKKSIMENSVNLKFRLLLFL